MRARTISVVAALTIAIAGAGAMHAGAASARVRAVPIATGLNGPAAFTIAPDGTIWYLERGTGEVHRLAPRTRDDRRIGRIRGVNGLGERGALGIALHPSWPTRRLVYAYVTRSRDGALQNQLVRFRVANGRMGRVQLLLTSPASSSPYHNGGRIAFGPDGKLYVMVGDGHSPANAQDLTRNLRGKILRVNPDGSAATGNPFGRIWSFGHRNSFGFAFDPQTDRLWETENGPSCTDEINLVVSGGNFAWGPSQDCALARPGGTNNSGPGPQLLPEWYFSSPIGITGAAFCDGCRLGPAVAGDLLFGDVNTGSVRAIDLNAARTGFSGSPRVLLDPPTAVYSLEAGPNGRLFFSGPTGIWRLVRA